MQNIYFKKNLAYVIGLALGDGNLSNPNGRAVRLRITCDTKYKNLIKDFCSSIQKLLPENKVSIVKRAKTFCDISCYSNKWENWLGWRVGKGSKYEQKISVPEWIKQNKKFSIECLRGLMQTDGCVYIDRGYKMIGFVTIVPTLANDVISMIIKLGFKVNIYKIKTKTKARYNIRISKDAEKFIRTLELRKN